MKLDFKHLIYKTVILTPLLLVSFILFLKNNDVSFDKSTSLRIDFKTWESPFNIHDIKNIFPNAVSYEKSKKNTYVVYNSIKEELGIVINSSPYSNEFFGYTGRVPVIIGVNNCQKIEGISLLENSESKESITAIRKKGYLTQWNQSPIDSINSLMIDAVSGATFTSNAIRDGINARISVYLNNTQKKELKTAEILKNVSAVALLLFAMLSYFRPKVLKKYRILLLTANVLVFGFWLGYSLSLFLIDCWIVNGIFLKVHLILFGLLSFSILLPFFFDKAFYCSYVCPMGSCQELCGKIISKKLKIKQNIAVKLKAIPKLTLIAIAFLLLINYGVDLSLIEPFMAFNFQTAKIYTLVFALIVIVASIFIRKPWCNYFCPTGQLFDLIRKPKKTEE